MSEFSINQLVLGPFETNCYILTIQGKTIIFDPGSDADTIIQFIDSNELKPDIILLTHAHIDHISAVREISEKYSIEVYLNRNDEALYNSPLNSLEPFFPRLSSRAKTTSLFKLTPLVEAIYTPGHTQGGTCFYIPTARVLISGDTIFSESIGRTDLPGGNHKQLIASIKEKVLALPPETIVYPGHGPETTIEHELKFNPYI